MGTVLLIQYSVYRTVILRKWYAVDDSRLVSLVSWRCSIFFPLNNPKVSVICTGVMGAMLRVRTWNQQLKTKRVVTGA